MATQEEQANEAAHSAEAQAEALSQQSVQEKEDELKQDAATAEQEVPAEDFSLEEQIEAVTKEHTEAVEGILADSAKLKEENADLEARVTTAKSNKEVQAEFDFNYAHIEMLVCSWIWQRGRRLRVLRPSFVSGVKWLPSAWRLVLIMLADCKEACGVS